MRLMPESTLTQGHEQTRVRAAETAPRDARDRLEMPGETYYLRFNRP